MINAEKLLLLLNIFVKTVIYIYIYILPSKVQGKCDTKNEKKYTLLVSKDDKIDKVIEETL